MLNKFNRRTSIFVKATLAIPIFFILLFIYKGLDVVPSIFYGFIFLLLSLIMSRNMYWMYVSGFELRIKYFSLFKKDTLLQLDRIKAVEFEGRDNLMNLMRSVVTKGPDFIHLTTYTDFGIEVISLKSNIAVDVRELYNLLKKASNINKSTLHHELEESR